MKHDFNKSVKTLKKKQNSNRTTKKIQKNINRHTKHGAKKAAVCLGGGGECVA